MTDISNKTLAIFLLAAMVISLGGFIVSFSRLDNLGLTGRATSDTGTTNFTINQSISVVFTTNTVDFGVGNVNASGTHSCSLNTTGPGLANGDFTPNPNDCFGFNPSVGPLRIQNQGTQNVSLNISFNATNVTFVGGGLSIAPLFYFRSSLNETGSCGITNASLNNTMNTTLGFIVANFNYTVCNSTAFDWHTGSRTINIDLGIRIPQDAPSGVRAVLVTANAFSP